MPSRRSLLPLAALAPLLASCSFSFSAGGPDYEKLERGITDELNSSYENLDQKVSAVDCPRQSGKVAAGDTFICEADLDGNNVRVEVTAVDDKGEVNFKTLDVVYDLTATAQGLTKEITKDRGFKVTVSCGEGLKVVEAGKSFECEAADRRGDTRTVKVTAGAVGETDKWEIVAE